MIEGLKPYPEYKESGQEWLGKVPAHWSVLPNRALFDEVKDRDHPKEEMLSVTITRGIVRQKALLDGSSKKDSSNLNKSAYKLVQPGDIAYNKMRAWQGALGASTLRGIISPAYVVVRPRKEANPWFYHNLYRTPSFAKEAERWSYGITSDMWSLRPEHFKLIEAILPPPDEQAAIVRFLDHANRKIDGFIRAKRKLIGLLNEQNQAIIHRAVTGKDEIKMMKDENGHASFILQPSTLPKKPSGIPWLGDIPMHWDVMQLRQILSFGPKNGVSPQAASGTGVLSFSISAVRGGRITIEGNEKVVELDSARIAGFRVHKGDILLVRGNGNVALVGKCGLVDACPENCVYPDILMKLRPNEKMNAEFMVLAINSSYVTNQVSTLAKTSNGAFKVSGATVRSISMVVPPYAEQIRLIEEIGAETATVTTAIARTEREIALMQEYRTRLTADLVTGKLDVREAAANLPETPSDSSDMADLSEMSELSDESSDPTLEEEP